MRTLRYALTVLALLSLPSAALADHHQTKENDALMQEVKAIGAKMAEALIAQDFETMLGFYTDDAISLPNFSPRLDGVAAFKANHEQMAATGVKIRTFKANPTDVWASGNQVIEIGTFAITLEMPGAEKPAEDRGKYLTVFTRSKDGTLKIKAETWNTDLNPMEMAGAGQ